MLKSQDNHIVWPLILKFDEFTELPLFPILNVIKSSNLEIILHRVDTIPYFKRNKIVKSWDNTTQS